MNPEKCMKCGQQFPAESHHYRIDGAPVCDACGSTIDGKAHRVIFQFLYDGDDCDTIDATRYADDLLTRLKDASVLASEDDGTIPLYSNDPERQAYFAEGWKKRGATIASRETAAKPVASVEIDKRIERAAYAIHTVKMATQDYYDDDANLVDLLTDLLHYCDHHCVDFDKKLRIARDHHASE